MKTAYLKFISARTALFVFVVFFLSAGRAGAQCTSTFSIIPGPNGQVTVIATSPGSSLSTSSYTWNFNVGYIPVITGTGTSGYQQVPTFTANGIYTITLSQFISPSLCTPVTLTVNIISIPNCNISFNTSPVTSSLACNGSATINAPGMCTPSYTWIPAITGQNSLCPGTYTVLASGSSGGTCCPTATGVVTINTNTCTLNASFIYSNVPGGQVSFFSTSTGVTGSTTYSWNYGDGSAFGTGSTSVHQYTAAGTRTVYLMANNNSTCFSQSNNAIFTPTLCSLNASFTNTLIGADSVLFQSNSNGTDTTALYSWNFGDTGTGTGSVITHVYSSGGAYVVTLTVTNPGYVPPCVRTFTSVINISCGNVAAFNHTVGSNGAVAFRSASTGTNSSSTYYWDFGDSYTDIAPAPTHTYSNAGNHYVKHKVTTGGCSDSIIQSLNITGIPCQANATFSLGPTGTPQYWYAIPSYPFNVTSAVWTWGDGSSTPGLYTSHVYSVAGTYSICLNVTVSCGATGSYCTSQYMSKQPGTPGGVITVNILPPALKVGLADNASVLEQIILFPNPLQNSFTLLPLNETLRYDVQMLDLTGRIVYSNTVIGEPSLTASIDLPAGMYILRILQGQQSTNIKVLVEH